MGVCVCERERERERESEGVCLCTCTTNCPYDRSMSCVLLPKSCTIFRVLKRARAPQVEWYDGCARGAGAEVVVHAAS